MPVCNATSTVAACLRSIQRQSEASWQCILVDDGSADDTVEVVHAATRGDDRFAVIATPHRGLVAALNAGLGRCTGRFVARMDADDLMHRHRLATQVEALSRTGWAAAGCHVRLFPRASLATGRAGYERWLNRIDSPRRVREEAFVECPIAHPALMIRRDVLASFGYRDAGWPEDYDLILRLLAAGLEIGVVPRRLVCWRDSPARLSRVSATYGLDRFTACKAAFLAAGLLAETDRYVLWGYGETGRALRRALLAHDKRPAAIVEVHPGRVGNTIHGAPVITPEALAGRRGERVVVSVAGETARAQIRAAMHAMAFEELRDFVCAA